MYIGAQVVGVIAVTLFLLSYQFKNRKTIVFTNAISNVLYVVQYLMLGAYVGAVTDALSAAATVAAHNKDRGFIKKHTVLVAVGMNVLIFTAGMILYKNPFSLCSIIGALLQVTSYWMSEKKLRILSFAGAPFWLIYNISSKAIGPSVGSLLSIISIGSAILRYDILPVRKNSHS